MRVGGWGRWGGGRKAAAECRGRKGLPHPLETQMGEEGFPRVESEGAGL